MSILPLILAALLPAGPGESPGLLEECSQAPCEPSPNAFEIPQQRGGGWVYSTAPHLDLWFHGMATVDPVGPGPLPLYDPAYPTRIRAEKEKAGVSATPLDQRAGHFRDAFRRDPAFEVLHFLPLYFAEAGRTEVFAALETLAVTREGIPRGVPPRTQFGVTAIGAVLSTPGQRAILGDLVSVLRAEWDTFFSDYRRARLPAWDDSRREIQSLWDREFGPALSPLLLGLDLSGGTVFLTPAIGVEGRIFSGIPQNRLDNILVVSSPKVGEDARTAIFSMLREISFPLVRQALGSALEQERGESEALAGRAAIRAGALILGDLLPGRVPAYQMFFLSRAGRTGASTEALSAAFQAAYPISAAQLGGLRETISATVTNGGEV